ncbi:MAG TPA: hypothetical protein VH062_32100 [Polyangiaceae bacterium]|nr:hypothetical protein [Polyangiaceae bacterium]
MIVVDRSVEDREVRQITDLQHAEGVRNAGRERAVGRRHLPELKIAEIAAEGRRMKESAHFSSRSIVAEPLTIQSVPSAIGTPRAFSNVTGAVLPYRLMFERGAQLTSEPAVWIVRASAAVVASWCTIAVCGASRSFMPAAEAQVNSLCALASTPSARCGTYELTPETVVAVSCPVYAHEGE